MANSPTPGELKNCKLETSPPSWVSSSITRKRQTTGFQVLSSCVTNRPTMHTYTPELLCLVLLQRISPTVVILSNCSDSLPLITVNASIRAYVFCSPMSLVHSFSAYLHSLFLEACI